MSLIVLDYIWKSTKGLKTFYTSLILQSKEARVTEDTLFTLKIYLYLHFTCLSILSPSGLLLLCTLSTATRGQKKDPQDPLEL